MESHYDKIWRKHRKFEQRRKHSEVVFLEGILSREVHNFIHLMKLYVEYFIILMKLKICFCHGIQAYHIDSSLSPPLFVHLSTFPVSVRSKSPFRVTLCLQPNTANLQKIWENMHSFCNKSYFGNSVVCIVKEKCSEPSSWNENWRKKLKWYEIK